MADKLMADESLNRPSMDEAAVPGLTSPNGRFELIFQHDGNVVLYVIEASGRNTAIWNTDTRSTNAMRFVMQGDGNLCLYPGRGRVNWNSDTDGNPGAFLQLQDDGNLVVRSTTGEALWNSFDDNSHWYDPIVDVIEAVGTFIITIVGFILDVLAFVVLFITCFPIIGGIIRTIINWVTEIICRIVGVFDYFLSLAGVRPRKKIHFGVIVPIINGKPLANDAEIMEQVNAAIVFFDRTCNINMIFTGIENPTSNPPESGLIVSCDEVGFFNDWVNAGAYFEFNSATRKFKGSFRRLIGWGAEIIIFIVQDIIVGNSSTIVGCSFGPTHNYVVIEPNLISKFTAAHEIAHACGIFGHNTSPNNLMNEEIPPSTANPRLRNPQIAQIRTSKHCVYI